MFIEGIAAQLSPFILALLPGRVETDILRQHIKEQTEAYILDIAQSFEIQIQADVTVSREDPPVPEAVRLTGNLTAREKQQLSRRIEQELAIAKENQLWMD